MELDKEIEKMSIAEDTPLVLSNQEKYSSTERNGCSILGRFLNPPNQRMSNWILDMPRIWRLYSRVRGVALSQEKFQFIFKSEDDLNEVLKTGVWTQDDWCVVMDKWVEKPPDDYLMFLPIWIRLLNIPVNYYTEATIRDIAKCVGKVLTVELELEKSQSQDYVRVRVLLDVRNPLRNSKEVQLPDGDLVSISFDYERVRKRCFLCQRLTHEKNMCPFNQVDFGNVSTEVICSSDKQKGLSSDDGNQLISRPLIQNLPAGKMKEDADLNRSLGLDNFEDESMAIDSRKDNLALFSSSSVYDAGSSGLSVKQKSPRKRKAVVMKKNPEKGAVSEGGEVSFNIQFDKVFKRKTLPSVPEESTCLKMDDNTVVHDEPPLDQ